MARAFQPLLPGFRAKLDFEPRCCGLCVHARFDSRIDAATGECVVDRKRASNRGIKPFLVRQDSGTCCEKFVADEFISPQQEVA